MLFDRGAVLMIESRGFFHPAADLRLVGPARAPVLAGGGDGADQKDFRSIVFRVLLVLVSQLHPPVKGPSLLKKAGNKRLRWETFFQIPDDQMDQGVHHYGKKVQPAPQKADGGGLFPGRFFSERFDSVFIHGVFSIFR